ncbi:MAG: hypothetical protein K2N38_06100 [Oscillospiraceae bacterium]|nr:hypothetical protein [Oscillospiraceae bacterium]
MQKKKHFRRLKAKLHTLKDGALECIREYPAAKRENSNRFVDVITIVCVIGVSAVTILFTVIG